MASCFSITVIQCSVDAYISITKTSIFTFISTQFYDANIVSSVQTLIVSVLDTCIVESHKDTESIMLWLFNIIIIDHIFLTLFTCTVNFGVFSGIWGPLGRPPNKFTLAEPSI